MGQSLSRRSDYGSNAPCGKGTAQTKSPAAKRGFFLTEKSLGFQFPA